MLSERDTLTAHLESLKTLNSLSFRAVTGNVEMQAAARGLYIRYSSKLLDNERLTLDNVFNADGQRLVDLSIRLGLSKARLSTIFKRGVERLCELARADLVQPAEPSLTEPKPSNVLVTFQGDALEQAFDWSGLSDEERRLRAIKAASARDLEQLWQLTSAHLMLFGDKGARVSPRTQKAYRQALKQLLNDWQGVNLIRPATNAGVEWIRRLETRPRLTKQGEVILDKRTGEPRTYAPATVALKLAGVRGFYRALRWTGATVATPFLDVKPAKDDVHPWDKREAYSKADIEKLLDVAEEADVALVLLGAHAGLRISEATNLRWGDVALDNRLLRVVRGKGGKTASAAMSNRLRDALAALPRGQAEDFVLPYRSYRARERFFKLCQLAGVRYEGRAFHGTRHFAGVQAYKQFGTFDRVAEHLRQADVNQGKRYGYMADETLKDGVKDW